MEFKADREEIMKAYPAFQTSDNVSGDLLSRANW